MIPISHLYFVFFLLVLFLCGLCRGVAVPVHSDEVAGVVGFALRDWQRSTPQTPKSLARVLSATKERYRLAGTKYAIVYEARLGATDASLVAPPTVRRFSEVWVDAAGVMTVSSHREEAGVLPDPPPEKLAVLVHSGAAASSLLDFYALAEQLVRAGAADRAVVFTPLVRGVDLAQHPGVEFAVYGRPLPPRAEPPWWCFGARACVGVHEVYGGRVGLAAPSDADLSRAHYLVLDRLAFAALDAAERLALPRVTVLCAGLPLDSDGPSPWSAVPAAFTGLAGEMDLLSRAYSLPFRPLAYAAAALVGVEAQGSRRRAGLEVDAALPWRGTAGPHPVIVSTDFSFEFPRALAPHVAFVGGFLVSQALPRAPSSGGPSSSGRPSSSSSSPSPALVLHRGFEADSIPAFDRDTVTLQPLSARNVTEASVLLVPCTADLVQWALSQGKATVCAASDLAGEDVGARLAATGAGYLYRSALTLTHAAANATGLADRAGAALPRANGLAAAADIVVSSPARARLHPAPRPQSFAERWSLDTVFLWYVSFALSKGLIAYMVRSVLGASREPSEEELKLMAQLVSLQQKANPETIEKKTQ